VAEQADSNKERRGRDDALALAQSVDRVVAARGKNVVAFDMKKARPDEATLLRHLLGPTGNLRAPTMRRGKTLLVGFHPKEFGKLLGVES
jgi:hypothetical protein